jgi:hypothetical protein
MNSDLKPCSTMKDSGVPWLRKVPRRWRIERAKWLVRKMDRPVRASEEVVTYFRDDTDGDDKDAEMDAPEPEI